MSKLKKLQRLSLDELRVRGAQSLNSRLERRGWSALAKLPSDEEFFRLLARRELNSASALIQHFRTRTSPKFFAGPADRETTIATLRQTWADSAAAIVAKAEQVVAGRFDLLGLRGLDFGDPIDWQLEPVSGKRTPLQHWSQLNYLDAKLTGDKKIVWELNRHQYFVTLGQAYWLTGDDRFVRTFATHLESWMDQNPPKLGINWASSLEVAFRSISWLWAFEFFKESAVLSEALWVRALKFLYLHARHLETYLSTYFSPNTHLTGEALALFYLGTMLPEFRAAKRWQQHGRRILLEQLPLHVQADGVYFEQSSYYHRYTTDFYTHFLILSRLNNQPVPPDVETRLELLLNHLLYITRPDGTTPLFGDDDGGRLVMLDQRSLNDFRAALATGAVLFRRGDYKHVSGEAAEETLWLLGPQGLAEFQELRAELPASQSMGFRDGGIYVMRDGWNASANYMLLDCGPHGMNNCGHAHADALSFELAAGGQTLLIDPGTYTYTGSKKMRDWFRGSSAHNTLTVDGQSSSVPAGPFSWSTIAECHSQAWISRERFDFFSGKHDGYERLADPVAHTRSVLFLKHDYWVIHDRVRSEGRHLYDLWFHFDAGLRANLSRTEDSTAQEISVSGLKVAYFGGSPASRTEESPISHCYAEMAAAPVCVFTEDGKNEDFLTFMRPQAVTETSPLIREVEAIGGRAFEVAGESGLDVLLIRNDVRAEMARLASDFEWTWARFSHDGATVPEELVLIGGQWLEIGGREVLQSGRRINYLVARRVGDQFRIETDDGVLQLDQALRAKSQEQSAKSEGVG